MQRRSVLSLALVAGCSFTPSGSTGDDDGDGGTDDAGNRTVLLRDDSADDFAVVGAVTDNAVIEPWEIGRASCRERV